ncbi:MAG: response regulator [Chloroflexi bacterium]|nr:response regulator [Chloroflexota bacterium]
MADNNRTRNTTVLLVEDDKPLLEFFSTILRREGYEVITAENGVEALDIAKSQPGERIDILLSDVAMPYMGGVQLALNLRKFQPELRVLLTSAMPFQEISNQCGPTFKPEFLAKPFSVSDLTSKIKMISEAR